MNREEAISLYTGLDDDRKVDLLARIAFDLTICFREVTYAQAPSPESLQKMRGINELQHQLLSQLQKHFRHDEARYSDTDFITVLLERAEHHQLLPFFKQSLARNLSALGSS